MHTIALEVVLLLFDTINDVEVNIWLRVHVRWRWPGCGDSAGDPGKSPRDDMALPCVNVYQIGRN